jgi:hypothetical protein
MLTLSSTVFIAVVGAIQLSSNYFFACQGNEDHLVGLESYHSPNTQNPSSLGALPRWLSAGYRTIFSFQYFHWKVLALIGVWLLIERRIKQRRLEKLPPSKRLELSWRNRGDDLDVKIKPFFGVVLIVVVLYYMGVSEITNHSFPLDSDAIVSASSGPRDFWDLPLYFFK